ncbi:MAG: nucleotidyltransferase domain-containing protein [Natronospirillum sp.]
MRLSDEQRQILVHTVHRIMGNESELWLFGSRANDTALGGDIDLYIETPPIADPVQRRIELKLALYDQMGEQKIDVVHHMTSEPLLPIHEHARRTGLRLSS